MNEKPFTLQVFLPHKTTTGVVLEGFGVRVSATRSSVRAASSTSGANRMDCGGRALFIGAPSEM